VQLGRKVVNHESQISFVLLVNLCLKKLQDVFVTTPERFSLHLHSVLLLYTNSYGIAK